MKKALFVFLTCLPLLACEGRQKVVDTNIPQTDAVVLTEELLSDVRETTTDNRNYRQYIDEYDPKIVFLFEVEGNFTNSGNRELLVFYQRKSTLFVEGEKRDVIGLAYCFVLDPTNEKVERVYNIPKYLSMPFLDNTENDIDEDPMEELGREIIWLGKRIGCVGDFNENGKEEMYLFASYGLTIDPCFYEFNGIEFVEITDRYYPFARITGIDKERKIIHFDSTSRSNGDFSLIWNEITQMYEWLSGTRRIIERL